MSPTEYVQSLMYFIEAEGKQRLKDDLQELRNRASRINALPRYDYTGCRQFLLKRLLSGPVENTVLWKELKSYENERRYILDELRSWAVVRFTKALDPSGHMRVMFYLNIENTLLTNPKAICYDPKIAEAVKALRDKKRQ